MKAVSARKKKKLLILSLILSAIVILCGYIYYKYEEEKIRDDKYNTLKAIAELKIKDITEWREERLSEANFFSKDLLMIKNTAILLNDKNSVSVKKYLDKTLSHIVQTHSYENIFIISENLEILYGFKPISTSLEKVSKNFVSETFLSKRITFGDAYFCTTDQSIHYDICAPIFDNKNSVLAVLLFRINPEEFIYPLIKKWPLPNKTAETLLIRKEGDNVQFLNDLLFQSNPDMSFRIPLSKKEVVAVQAVSGRTGIIEAKDYRGKNVLACIYPVTGTNWIMIAKVDTSEIFSELWYRAIIITLFTVVSILFLITGVSFVYKYRQSIAYRELLKKEKELRENEEVFRITLYSIGDGVITTDTDGCVKQMNSIAEHLTGWSEAESIGKKIEEVFKIINEDSKLTVKNPVQRVLREGQIVGLANHTLLISKNGKETPIADSGAPIRNSDNEIIGVVLVFRDQTSERNSKKELEEREDKLKSIFRSAPVGIGLVINRIIKEVNQRLCEITGYSADELLQKSSRMLYENDEDYNFVGEEKYKQIAEKGTGTVITRWKRKTGEIINVLLSSTPLDVNDLLKGVTFTALDITEQIKANKALLESEKRYRNLFENHSAVKLILEPETGKIIEANQAAAKFYGWSNEELTSMKIQQINTLPEEEVKIQMSKARTNNNIHFEFKHRTADGSVKDVDVFASKIEYDGKEILHSIIHDVTESKKIKDALEQSEEDYKTLFNQAHDPIIVFLPENEIILDVNNRACEVYGYSKEELIGMSLEKISKNIEAGKEKINIVLSEGSFHGFETRQFRKDGSELTIEVNATRINYKNQNAILSINRDITERKKAEEKIRENEQRMRVIVEGTPNLFFYTQDTSGKITYISPSVEKITGHKVEEWINQSHWFVTNSKINETAVERTHAHLKGEFTEGSILVEVEHADNYPILLEVYENPVILEGKVIGLQGVAHDITARKKIENELIDSEELFRRAFLTSPDSININRLSDGMYVNINEGFTSITGYTQEEVIGKTSKEINIWANFRDRERLIEGLKKHGFVNNLEAEFRMKDGKIVTGLMSASVFNLRGVPHILSITRNISDIKKVQVELYESEKKYRSFFENDLTGDYISTVEGKLLSCNQSFADIFGFESIEQALNSSTEVIYDNENSREKFLAIVREKKNLINFEYEYKKTTGEKLYLIENTIGIFNDAGDLEQLQGYVFDNTKRKLAELQLKESEERFKGLFENAALGIYRGTPDGELLFGNKALMDILGCSSIEELKKIKASDLYVEKEERIRFQKEILEKGFVSGFEEKFYKSDGSIITISESARAAKDEKGNILFYEGIIEDITDKKENINLLRLQAELLIKLQSETDLDKILNSALKTILEINPFDSGGIYIKEESGLILKTHYGLSEKFVQSIKEINAGSYHFTILESKKPIFGNYKNMGIPENDPIKDEGLKEIAVIPLYAEDNLIGCINAASHKEKGINESERNAINSIGSILSEIIARINAYQELKESEERFRNIVQNSEAIFFTINKNGIFTLSEGNALKTLGLKPGEVVGLSAFEIYKDYPEIISNLNSALNGVAVHSLLKMPGVDFEMFYNPKYDDKGNVEGLIGLAFDITEKMKSQEELNNYKLHLENLVKQRTEQLKTINIKLAEEIRKQRLADKQLKNQLFMLNTFVESMPTAAFIKNSDLQFIEVNHAFEELVGKSKKQILGKQCFDVFPLPIAKILNSQDQEVLLSNKMKSFNLEFEGFDKKKKYLIVNKVPYQQALGEIGGILGTYIDISEQKKLQESIERSLAKEKELSDLKSRFISMASHEFRTPLTSIRIFSDLIEMQKEKNNKEKLSEYIEKIQNSVSYMTDLINDVLTVSRAETGKLKLTPETMDLKTFCEDLINEIKLNVSSKHKLTLQYKSKRTKIFADSKLLRYIFSNLLSNAVKYSPNGGDINVTSDIVKSYVKLTVSDNGIGMSETVMKNLFEPFLRGDNIGSIPGTGLGLSIIKKAVDLHNGQITCKSILNKGTSFVVTIPLNQGKNNEENFSN